MPVIVQCYAKHPFRGDPAASQLSFVPGEIVCVDLAKPGHNGWVWGSTAEVVTPKPLPSRSGWCPSSYLVKIAEAVPASQGAPAPAAFAPSPPPPSLVSSVVSVESWGSGNNDDNGFEGPILGGSAIVAETAASSCRTQSSSRESFFSSGRVSQRRASMKNSFTNLGSSVQNAGRSSWTAVSGGAQKAGGAIASGAKTAGTYTKAAAKETKYRVQDMTGQTPQLQKQQPQHNTGTGKKPLPHQIKASERTHRQQKAVDVGNYAARGAVMDGVTSAILNPRNMVQAGVHGAVRGGVCGGTYGGVKDWKPFN